MVAVPDAPGVKTGGIMVVSRSGPLKVLGGSGWDRGRRRHSPCGGQERERIGRILPTMLRDDG
jgi:hypothetical protein